MVTLRELRDLTFDTYWAHTKYEEDVFRISKRVLDILGETKKAPIQGPQVALVAKSLRDSGLSNGTVNRHLSCLSKMSSHQELLGLGPKPKMIWLKEPQGRTRILSLLEEEALVEAMPMRSRDLVLFLLYTGARVSEALAVTEKDLEESQVTFRHTKTDRARTVGLPSKARGLGPFDLTQSQFSKDWAKARESLGFSEDPEFVPHMLRHTCATRLVRSGARLDLVQGQLGHSSITMVMRYAHAGDSEVLALADLLDDAGS